MSCPDHSDAHHPKPTIPSRPPIWARAGVGIQHEGQLRVVLNVPQFRAPKVLGGAALGGICAGCLTVSCGFCAPARNGRRCRAAARSSVSSYSRRQSGGRGQQSRPGKVRNRIDFRIATRHGGHHSECRIALPVPIPARPNGYIRSIYDYPDIHSAHTTSRRQTSSQFERYIYPSQNESPGHS